jgi:cell division protein FtsW (lipid II flippase)
MKRLHWRWFEALLLLVAFLIAGVGFYTVSAAALYRQGLPATSAVGSIFLPLLVIILAFSILHWILSIKKVTLEQTILPVTALLFILGMTMIWRLRGEEGVLQQITRGLIPGFLAAAALFIRPDLVERIRKGSVVIGLGGLFLLFLTGVMGVKDETGARLALRIGPISVQTSEMIKVTLIIFLAWYIEKEGKAAEGRAHTLLWFRLPALRYLTPAAAFVGAATLALVAMSDFGAVIILGCLFITMLFIGFETRTFLTIMALGLGLALVVGLILSQFWKVPNTIQYRYLAFRNPWSSQVMPNGYTIAEGPGYQIEQSVYAIIAGGVSGAGLGLGSPTFIPLAHSDFIMAAIFEEMGSAVGFAILVFYAILILRIIRLVFLLPADQIFERLLLCGIAVHFFTQVFVMAGGTFDLIPLTGVTLPFLSLGGVSLFVNLVEVGFVLTLVQRVPTTNLEKGQK